MPEQQPTECYEKTSYGSDVMSTYETFYGLVSDP